MILRMNTKISFIFFYDILLKLGFPRNSYIFCAKFALFSRKFYFCELLRIKRIFFAQFAQNRKYFVANFCALNGKSFAQFAQNLNNYANRNFLSKLTKIEILSTELNK